MCLLLWNRSVTMPLKSEILKHLDEISPVSEATGACNTIVRVKREDGSIKLVGTNTDFLGKSFFDHDALKSIVSDRLTISFS